ncbi:MAG TPA: HEAT repeat domain-containing protein [Vicinamibacteria bacterium]|jgi:HEAT repeat protein/cyclophilin family peptidyl-prolyl cis-trans isomerase
MRGSLRVSTGVLSAFVALGCPKPEAPVAAPPTAEEKIARAMKLEDERSDGDGELELLLQDLDGRVRARAALALGRLGDPERSSALVPLLSDPSAYVRDSALFAIGILEGAPSEDAVARLTESLRDEDPRVRGRAAEVLGRRAGESASEAIGSALAEWVPRGGEPYEWGETLTESSVSLPHPDVRGGLFALGRLRTTRFAWNAIATEGATPRFTWWPAAWTASELQGDELEPLQLFYAGSPDPVFRLYGARGLGNLRTERARSQLRSLVFDPNEKVRIEAVRAAARLGASELLPDLLGHLEADTRYVQVEILRALTVLRSEAAVEPLIDRIGDPNPWIRGLALEALAQQDRDSFWLLLAGIGADPAWQVRRRLAELFATLPGDRPKELLRDLTEDPDARVRARALRSLREVSPEMAGEVAIRHLAATDPFERVAAAETLAAIGSKDAFAPIEQAFLEEKEEDPRVRAALLRALSAMDSGKAQPLVTRSLDDPSYFLRRAAGDILSRAGIEAVVRPRSSELALEDYMASLRAPYSPQAFLRTSRGTVTIELFIADAPQTVANFIRLARKGFFKGLPFYEVVPNGHVASGDPRGDGWGGPGYVIRSEINERPMLRGTLAMVEEAKDSAGSRFLITHLPEPGLEGRSTVFGIVTSGMEVVDGLEPSDGIEEVTIWDGITSPYPR